MENLLTQTFKSFLLIENFTFFFQKIYSLLIFMKIKFPTKKLCLAWEPLKSPLLLHYPDYSWNIYWQSVWNFYLLPTTFTHIHTPLWSPSMNFNHVWSTFKLNFLTNFSHPQKVASKNDKVLFMKIGLSSSGFNDFLMNR